MDNDFQRRIAQNVFKLNLEVSRSPTGMGFNSPARRFRDCKPFFLALYRRPDPPSDIDGCSAQHFVVHKTNI